MEIRKKKILLTLFLLGIVSVGTRPPKKNLDYVAMLNRALPNDIRVLGWTPVPVDFSARFVKK